jgi:hypothetical protein
MHVHAGGYMAYHGMVANPLFYLIWLAGAYETFVRLYDPVGTLPPNFYKITSHVDSRLRWSGSGLAHGHEC